MPDNWETAHGLNPAFSQDGNEKSVDPNGEYTNLEAYLNGLVEEVTNKQNEGGTISSSIHSEICDGDKLMVSAYPNPVKESLTISSNSELNKAELVTLTGSLLHVFMLEGTQSNINLSSLNDGVYLLRISDNKERCVSLKVLK